MTGKRGILVTGGAGYIGSHTCVELVKNGYHVVVLDNFSNSSPTALDSVTAITGQTPYFYQGDVRNQALLSAIFNAHSIDAVVHFAGLKSIGESVQKPLEYFDNNVAGTLSLLNAMRVAKVSRLVFSSSATVYGDPQELPIRESAGLSVTNPYGRSKLLVEQMLNDLVKGEGQWQAGILRYFNPVGAHSSGLIGENPSGTPNNLLPYVAKVAAGELPKVRVFGNDYPTIDGTGVRDYIHVVDLAIGHLRALERLFDHPGSFTANLGTGSGYSVMEMIKAFEAASSRTIPFEFVNRRPGDISTCYADPSYAFEILGWRATKTLQEMCNDHWRWQLELVRRHNKTLS